MRNTVATLALALSLPAGAHLLAQEPPSTPAAPAPAPPAAAAPAPELPAAPDAPRTFYEGVRVTFDGKAKTPGVVGLDVQPSGGAPKRVWVRALAKTGADELAEQVAKELTFALGAAYKVKGSGRGVTVARANKSTPPVCVTVAGMTLYGVSVMVEED